MKKKNNLTVNHNIPDFIFDSIEQEIEIGEWLGVISFSDKKKVKPKVSNRIHNEISEKFGEILSLIGLPCDELCFLYNYNKNESKVTFCCELLKSDKEVEISLKHGSFAANGPEITVNYQNTSKTYTYIESYDKHPIELRLKEYTITSRDNGNKCFRYLSQYRSYFSLKNGEYCLYIDIDSPRDDILPFSNRTFKLENEEKLEQYLLRLSFPIAINEVFEKIYEHCLEPIENYPRIALEVKKGLEEDEKVITDSIIVVNGELNNFIITREGKTISINENDIWTFKSDKVFASDNNGLSMTFNLGEEDDITKQISPLSEFNKIQSEVRKVKQLKKTIFKK